MTLSDCQDKAIAIAVFGCIKPTLTTYIPPTYSHVLAIIRLFSKVFVYYI